MASIENFEESKILEGNKDFKQGRLEIEWVIKGSLTKYDLNYTGLFIEHT